MANLKRLSRSESGTTLRYLVSNDCIDAKYCIFGECQTLYVTALMVAIKSSIIV